jgi:superfamily II DNA or RNA helicase
MSLNLTVRWGDGFISVEPAFPEALEKSLKYWHRSLEWDSQQMRRVATGCYRELYSITGFLDENQQYVQQLVTMPGFLHRIKTTLDKEGYTYTIIDERTPAPEPDLKSAAEKLLDYQLECIYVAIKSGGGIIACPTGWGKTHIIGAIARAYSHEELCARNTPTIVVAAPQKDITRKNYTDLCDILPERNVGLVMSGMKKTFSDDVQLITFDSLHLLNPDDIGVLIADEVHAAPTSKRSETILAARKALRWGMSATPTGRWDGRDLVAEGLFGPPVYKRTYQQGIEDGALVPIKVYWLPCPEPDIGVDRYLKYKRRNSKYTHGVFRNKNQNKQISEMILSIPDEQQLLCIMPQLDQMNRIAEFCPEVKIVHAETSQDSLTKRKLHNLVAVSTKQRRAIYDQMRDGEIRKILSTYVYKEGVNFPELTIIVNAGGGASELVHQQIPGRESRNIEHKHESYLIDFYHPWDMETGKNGRSQPGPVRRDDQAREKAYTKLGFDQVWLDSPDELPFVKKPTKA